MKKNDSGQPNVNMISSDTVITGTFKTKSDFRISGTLDGEIHTESKCIISESGLVKGDLKCKEADIAGTLEGELLVSNRLVLRNTAKIVGDIRTKILMVEEGALIEGSCKMGDHDDAFKDNEHSRKTASQSTANKTASHTPVR